LRQKGIGLDPQVRTSIELDTASQTTLLASTEPYVYVVIPVLTGRYDFQNNDIAQTAFRILPQVFRDYEESSTPDFVILRLLDILTYGHNIASDYLTEWTYVDYIDGYNGSTDTPK
jgi:hypothetical protein